MSMLAEPKRKQKFGPDPRNTFWSNDETKFGFRMLETMGWSKGKGLGTNEDGRTEHVKAVHRNTTDARGVGCSKNYADNWLAHQDDFNSLLSSLNATSDSPQTSSDSPAAIATSISLEEKSKSSRSRVHYHKFTRGKDLSSRSAKDLDGVFGKRKGQSSGSNSPAVQSKVNSDEEDGTERPSFSLATSTPINNANDNNNKADCNPHGVKTIISSASVQDYFAMKMAELKQKREGGVSGHKTMECTEVDEPAALPDGDAAEKSNKNGDAAEKSKKKKKKKKSKEQCEEEEEDISPVEQSKEADQEQREVSSVEQDESSKPKKMKKKKREKKGCDVDACEDISSFSAAENVTAEQGSVSEVVAEKKKSKKKRKLVESEETEPAQQSSNTGVEAQCHEGDMEPLKKSKKKKRRNKLDNTLEESLNSSILRHENDGKERRRKSVSFSVGGNEIFVISPKQKSQEGVAMKKLSKKRKREEDSETSEDEAPSEQSKPDEEEEDTASDEGNTITQVKDKQNVVKEVGDSSKKENEGGEKSRKKSKKHKGDIPVQQVSITSTSDSNNSESSEEAVSTATVPQIKKVALCNSSSDDNKSNKKREKRKRQKENKRKMLTVPTRVDTICEAFVGSNLSRGFGYGNDI